MTLCLVGPDEKEIEKIVNILSKNFKVEDQGDLSDYLGVNIERRKDGKIEMTQPTLTLSILKDILGLTAILCQRRLMLLIFQLFSRLGRLVEVLDNFSSFLHSHCHGWYI